jgi:hypothetical protein
LSITKESATYRALQIFSFAKDMTIH